jgi:CBS-domain-containing membrane protein
MTAVRDRMLTRCTTHPAGATIGDAREFFSDDHKHLMLLVADGRLLGTVVRSDLTGAGPDDRPALEVAVLRGRTVAPDDDVDRVRTDLLTQDMRRIAVVGEGDRLLGLLCLKKHRRGFCSDDDVAARAEERVGYFAGSDEA